MMLVGVALMVGHWLEHAKVDWMSEAAASLIIGIVVGMLLWLMPFSAAYEGVFHFSVRPLHTPLCAYSAHSCRCLVLPAASI